MVKNVVINPGVGNSVVESDEIVYRDCPNPDPKPDPKPEKECCCKTYHVVLHFH